MNISIKKITDLSSENLIKLDSFVLSQDNSTVFHTSDWLLNIFSSMVDSINESFLVYDNNRIVCLFPIFITKRKRMTFNLSYQAPNYSSYPLVDNNLSEKNIFKLKEVITNYLDKLDNIILISNQSPVQFIKEKHISINDLIGITTLIGHQVVFIPENENEILINCEGKYRRDVVTAKSVNYTYRLLENYEEKKDSIESIIDCYKIAYSAKYGKKPPLENIEAYRISFFNMIQSKFVQIFFLEYQEKVISYSFLFIFKDMAYFSDSYTIRSNEYPKANSFVLYKIMKKLSEKKIKYFELAPSYHFSNDNYKKNIYLFKRSLGAKIIYAKKSFIFNNKRLNKMIEKIAR